MCVKKIVATFVCSGQSLFEVFIALYKAAEDYIFTQYAKPVINTYYSYDVCEIQPKEGNEGHAVEKISINTFLPFLNVQRKKSKAVVFIATGNKLAASILDGMMGSDMGEKFGPLCPNDQYHLEEKRIKSHHVMNILALLQSPFHQDT